MESDLQNAPLTVQQLAELLGGGTAKAAVGGVSPMGASVTGKLPSSVVVPQVRYTGRGKLICLRLDLTNLQRGPDFYVSFGPVPFPFVVQSCVFSMNSQGIEFGFVPYFSANLFQGKGVADWRLAVIPFLGSAGARGNVQGAWCPDVSDELGFLQANAIAPRGYPNVGFYMYTAGEQPITAKCNMSLLEINEVFG